jgi:hypothetical protein
MRATFVILLLATVNAAASFVYADVFFFAMEISDSMLMALVY